MTYTERIARRRRYAHKEREGGGLAGEGYIAGGRVGVARCGVPTPFHSMLGNRNAIALEGFCRGSSLSSPGTFPQRSRRSRRVTAGPILARRSALDSAPALSSLLPGPRYQVHGSQKSQNPSGCAVQTSKRFCRKVDGCIILENCVLNYAAACG
jgi:hypothetical protein